MPRTIQQSMVSTRAMISLSPATPTMALISSLARPVMVIVPEMIPATPQAAPTVMADLPPADRASRILPGVRWASLLMKPTTMDRTMAREAALCMVMALVDTQKIRATRGISR